jgi:hypothetical protein
MVVSTLISPMPKGSTFEKYFSMTCNKINMKPMMQEEDYLILSPTNTAHAKANQNFSYFSPAIKQIITHEDFP